MKNNFFRRLFGCRGIRIVLPLCIAVSVCGCNGDDGGSNARESASEEIDEEVDDSSLYNSSKDDSASDSSTSDNSADDAENDEITPSDQLQTFYNTRDQWELVDGTYDDGNQGITFNDGYSYAVTDIDDDGNLEILMSGMAGSGHYSINVFYEFSDIDTIEKMDTKGLEFNESEPDISGDYLARFVDDQGEINYLFTDYENYGASGGKTNYYSVTVEDNSFLTSLVGYVESYQGTTSYYDDEENRISLNGLNWRIERTFKEENFKSISKFYDVTLDNIKASYDAIADYKGITLEDLLIEPSELNEELSDEISIIADDAILDYSDIDEESQNLYKDFLTGDADALVMDSCADVTDMQWFKDSFSGKKACSLEQIMDEFDENEGVPYGDKTVGRYIDCGLDGNYEFLIQVQYSNGCNLYIVIKNIDGKLYICYIDDGWERKAVSFKENGFCGYMWNVNGSLHEGNNYYIDADGVCHLYEHFSYDSIDDEVLESDYPDSILNSYNVDLVEFSLLCASEDDLDPVYLYGIDIRTDDGFIDRTDETEELFLEAERILEERGYTIISDEEAEEMLQEFRESAGFTEEIYNAEVAYYGD